MKFYLISILLLCVGNIRAQTILKSSFKQLGHSIEDDGKTLKIRINGQRLNGEKVRYNGTYNLSGMSAAERDSLKANILDSLGIKYTFLKPEVISPAVEIGQDVKFTCDKCDKRGHLEVYGKNFVSTRRINSRFESHSFPVTISLRPGDYQLFYYHRRKSQAIQFPFTVKKGENGFVVIQY